MIKYVDKKDTDKIASLLKLKYIGVFPTDTIYGIQCLAKNKELHNRIAQVKKQRIEKPMINIISSISQLNLYDIELNHTQKNLLATLWPGPNTCIFKLANGNTIAIRLPKSIFLTSIINITGPLISTSANLHRKPYSRDINSAIKYFGEHIDFYVDGGIRNSYPSSIYNLTMGAASKIR
jgi:L-threonylcarbamoyladenylate synthase